MRHLNWLILLPGLISGQTPRVGVVDFYGVQKVGASELRKVLAVREGDPLPASKGDLEDKLEKISGVVRSQVSAVCCEAGKAILYVGIEEKGAPHFDYRPAPDGTAQLPEEVARTYVKFLGAMSDAGGKGDLSEDLTHGHSLMSDPRVRAVQEEFVPLAVRYMTELKAVLREGPNDEQRAMAAYVIGYAPKKTAIVDDLLYALQDPDDTVRGNAMRSLAALAVLAAKDPASGVKLPPTWVVEMLNSVIWTDRHNAAVTLVTMTESRDQQTLDLMRERALDSLVNMAGWKHLPHALPGYILLGRLAGLSEPELQSTWSAGRRQSVIDRFKKK